MYLVFADLSNFSCNGNIVDPVLCNNDLQASVLSINTENANGLLVDILRSAASISVDDVMIIDTTTYVIPNLPCLLSEHLSNINSPSSSFDSECRCLQFHIQKT